MERLLELFKAFWAGSRRDGLPRVFISAAETSADMHGAALIRAVQALRPDIEFLGVAGPAMEAQGCVNLFNFARHSAMLAGAFKHISKGLKLMREVKARFRNERWDAVVVIDSPVLHLPMAAKAKRAGIPVLYYVAPQLWAWGKWRMAKLRRNTDRIAAILPFEAEFFRGHGCEVEFVGHPLFDTLRARPVDAERIRSIKNSGNPIIAILPGSREHVVEEVLAGQLEVAAAIRRKYASARAFVSIAKPELSDAVRRLAAKVELPVELVEGPLGELLSAADLTLVASGTATLEVAYYGSPMIVMYNGSKLLYHLIGRWLIKTNYLSLLNILANQEIVPEFMPYYDSTEPICTRALAILNSHDQRASMKKAMALTLQTLERGSASANVADILLHLMEKK